MTNSRATRSKRSHPSKLSSLPASGESVDDEVEGDLEMDSIRRREPGLAPEVAEDGNEAAAENTAENNELAASDVAEFFGATGPLAQRFDGYELRPSQQEMAQAVKRALLNPSVALIEAPTGT